MEDYPKTLAEFEARFSTEEACRHYLARLRWPMGFVCPRCGHRKAWNIAEALFQCAACGHQTSVTAGTVFDKTRKPLTLWFRAVWWLAGRRSGASAREFQRILALGSYQTAWTWLHKLRRAMVRPGRQKLSGTVEADVAPLPCLQRDRAGGQRYQIRVAIAVEAKGRRGTGRVRLRRVSASSQGDMEAFIESSVDAGTTVFTSHQEGFEGLAALGFTHRLPSSGGRGMADVPALPRVDRIAPLLDRWLREAHQAAVSLEHLDAYLDEFTFWFNRRASRSQGKIFHRLLRQAVFAGPVSYRGMVRHIRGPSPTERTDARRGA